MRDVFKAIGALFAIFAVIALGLLWPSDDVVQEDPVEPISTFTSLSALGNLSGNMDFQTIVKPHTIHSSMSEIRSGRFKYREPDVSWRFTVPMNWGKVPSGKDVRRVIQQWAMADPFLTAYEETGDTEAFKQAVFFAVDWQDYHQNQRQITRHAWDADSIRARAARLAYILSEAETQSDLLNSVQMSSLISLSDFHIKRISNQDLGAEVSAILQTSEFKALCQVLDGLPSCESILGETL
jgi:hypothetical protein